MTWSKEQQEQFPLVFLLKMQSIYDSLKTAERKAADYILAHPNCLSTMTISEVASSAQCSDPTLVRLARKLGYKGYLDFKNQTLTAKQQELNTGTVVEYDDIDEADSAPDAARKIFCNAIQSLSGYLTVFDDETYQRAAVLLAGANQIGFFGAGDSGLVALYGCNKSIRTGIPAFHTFDSDMMLGNASHLTADDAAVIVSHSGQSRAILNVVKLLRTRGVPTVLITNYSQTQMAKYTDVVLLEYSYTRNEPGGEQISCRLIELCLLDSLLVNVLRKDNVKSKHIADYRQAVEELNRY